MKIYITQYNSSLNITYLYHYTYRINKSIILKKEKDYCRISKLQFNI